MEVIGIDSGNRGAATLIKETEKSGNTIEFDPLKVDIVKSINFKKNTPTEIKDILQELSGLCTNTPFISLEQVNATGYNKNTDIIMFRGFERVLTTIELCTKSSWYTFYPKTWQTIIPYVFKGKTKERALKYCNNLGVADKLSVRKPHDGMIDSFLIGLYLIKLFKNDKKNLWLQGLSC